MVGQDSALRVKLPFGRKFRILFSLLLLGWFSWFISSVFEVAAGWNDIYHQPWFISAYNDYRQAYFNSHHAAAEEEIIILGGDVMLARHVQQLQEACVSYVCAWENIAQDFKLADLAIVNLESPLSDQEPYPTEGFVFKAKPENLSGLQAAGIDVALLANNHFGNGGEHGMVYTFDYLDDHGISYVGAGVDENQAYAGKIINVNGLKLGLINQSYDVPWYAARAGSPGIATLNLEQLKSGIKLLAGQGADIIIALFHGGVEYVREPNQDQIDFARTAIDAGADLVVGHHPHWIQQIDKYRDKYIFYSLGNLIFDQNWSVETSRGLVLEVKVRNKKIEAFELRPVVIEENFKPRWAEDEEAGIILDNIPGIGLVAEFE